MRARAWPAYVPTADGYVDMRSGELVQGRSRGVYYLRIGESWFRLGYLRQGVGASQQAWLPMRRPPKGWPEAWRGPDASPTDNVVSLDAWRKKTTAKR